MSRQLKIFCLFLSSLLLTGCLFGPKSATTAFPEPRALSAEETLPVIDVHIHTRFDGREEATSKTLVTRDQLRLEMKESGVVAAVSHTSEDESGFYAEAAEDQVIHCLGLGEKIEAKKIDRLLSSGRYHCLKVYLGYVHRFASHEDYRQAYRLAEKHKIPVVLHTGDTYTSKGKLKYADPLTVDEIAVDFPQVKFLIAHLGNPWTKSAAEVAYKNPNVYIEASALLIGNLNEVSPRALERFLLEPISWSFDYIEDPSKFMYGTDWPLTGMRETLKAYKRAIPREHWCRVFYQNAVEFFQMKTRQEICRVKSI